MLNESLEEKVLQMLGTEEIPPSVKGILEKANLYCNRVDSRPLNLSEIAVLCALVSSADTLPEGDEEEEELDEKALEAEANEFFKGDKVVADVDGKMRRGTVANDSVSGQASVQVYFNKPDDAIMVHKSRLTKAGK